MGRYNFYGNSTFKIGDKIKVVEGAGIDSGKEGTVIPHFNWREEPGAYSPPDKDDVPIQLPKHKSYFPKNYLRKIEP